MTQPSFILFKVDHDSERPSLAVGVHLYATAQRGAIVECMFARITSGEVTRDLDLWVYGKKTSLMRGSGIRIGQEGVTGDHHFLLGEDEDAFHWKSGAYTIEIFGTIVGRPRLHRFLEVKVVLDANIGKAGDATSFDWQPATRRYKARVVNRAERVPHGLRMLCEMIANDPEADGGVDSEVA